jgi:peptide/nickel transport system substrate-binding protein
MPIASTPLTLMLAAALAVTSAAPVSAQTLRIALQEDPDRLDPAQGGTFVGRIVFAALCDKLIDIDQKLDFVPQLATQWGWSQDGKVLTMQIRSGVVFHDGTPLDGEAVKINIDRYRTADYSRRKTEVKSITNVAVIDPLTVRIELSEPDAPLLSALADRAGMMLSPKALAAQGQNVANQPACAGPFRFVERVAQQKIVLQRFENYWDASRIHVDQVIFQPMPDTTVRTANLLAGSLELVERLQPTDLKQLKEDRRVKVVTHTALAYNTLSINLAHGPGASHSALAKDARVREALELALDRQALIQVVFDGEYIATNQPHAIDSPWYIKEQPIPARDIAKARQLLADAGIARPAFTLSVANSPLETQVAQVVQSMLGEAGFDMKIEVLEANTLTSNATNGNYEAALVIWSGRADPDGNISIWLACDGFLNWGKYCNPELDARLAAARHHTSPQLRLNDYAAAARIYLADRAHIFLYNYKWLWGVADKLDGFIPHPDGIIRLKGVRFRS